MSHVADGILHAYLDGALDALSDAGELPAGATAADVRAHLTACADCRARLETERAIREGAGVVLSDASLQEVDVPAFAGVRRSRRARRTGWLPLGWAASVLLAVGAGWWGSEAWRAERSGGLAVERTPAEQASTQAPTDPASTYAAPEQASAPVPLAQRAGPDVETTEARGPANAGSRSAQLRAESGSAELPPAAAADHAETVAAAPAALLSAPPAVAVAPAAVTAEPPAAAAGNLSRARETREPIGTALSDSTASNAFRTQALALEQRVVRGEEIAATAPSPAAPLPFTPASSVVGRTIDSPATGAEKARLLSDAGRMAAFDSILARERSGRMYFSRASDQAVDDQLFIIAGASAPMIEVASQPGQTTVRVRQTLSGGERVEIVIWRDQTIILDQLVVTGVPARRSDAPARSEAAARADAAAQQYAATADTLQVISPTARRIEDGRRELVLRSSGPASMWIAIRAEMSEIGLRALTLRLRRP